MKESIGIRCVCFIFLFSCLGRFFPEASPTRCSKVKRTMYLSVTWRLRKGASNMTGRICEFGVREPVAARFYELPIISLPAPSHPRTKSASSRSRRTVFVVG